MIYFIFRNIIAPFITSFTYSIIFNTPKKYYLPAGILGVSGWLVYIWAKTNFTEMVAAFFATMVAALLSRIATVVLRCPITVFLATSIISIVPGMGIYNTTYFIVTGDIASAYETGMGALKIVCGIVLGLVIVMSIPREAFFALRRKRR